MIKRNSLILLLNFLGGFIFAQETTTAPEVKNKKGCAAISIGMGFPMSSFASKNIADSTAGYANPGLHINVSGSYLFTKHIGVTVIGLSASYPFDLNPALAKFYANGNATIVENTKWEMKGALGGLYMESGSSSVVLTFRGLLGVISAKSPANTLESISISWEQTSVSATDIGASFGIGTNIRLSKMLNLVANIDYFITKPQFENVEVFINGAHDGYYTVEKQMNSLTVTAGLGISF